MQPTTVLIIEDDSAIRQGLVGTLQYAGYKTLQATDGNQGLTLALEANIDLILLDVMLPKRNGFDILDEVRKSHPQLPIIILTARGAEEDRVRGLQSGADDYVVKPFSAREVLARIEAVLRRSAERPHQVASIQFDTLTINLNRREITDHDSPTIELTERETEILHYLAANPRRAIDRDELMQNVWGLNPRGLETRAVDMQIRRLREKLNRTPDTSSTDHSEPDHSNPSHQLILTVRGKGYMLHHAAEVVQS